MERCVALLRGINVGGKNRLPMEALAAAFRSHGCRDIRTYIQSGNVVFQPPGPDLEALGRRVGQTILDHHGLRVPVVMRTGGECVAAAESHPFGEVDLGSVHLCFLAGPGDPSVLDAHRSPGDSFVVVGRDIYLHLPGGVARTRLTNAYFDRALGTVSTVRNWATVTAIADLVRAP